MKKSEIGELWQALLEAAKTIEERISEDMAKPLFEVLKKYQHCQVVKKAPKVNDLVAAVAKVNDVSIERAEEWLAGKDRGFKISLRKDRRIAQALLELAGDAPTKESSVFEGI